MPNIREAVNTHLIACDGQKLCFLLDGQPVDALSSNITQADQTLPLTPSADGKQHWLRPDVVDGDGKLLMMENAIYLN